MKNNYPPDYDPRIDSGEDEEELVCIEDMNEDDDPQWEDKRLDEEKE
jgi:hypothetical protein